MIFFVVVVYGWHEQHFCSVVSEQQEWGIGIVIFGSVHNKIKHLGREARLTSLQNLVCDILSGFF